MFQFSTFLNQWPTDQTVLSTGHDSLAARLLQELISPWFRFGKLLDLEATELTPVTIPLIMTESISFSLRTLSSAVPLKPSNVCFVMTFRFWNYTQTLLLKYRLRILRIWFTANAQMLHPMLNKAFNSCKNTLPNQISWWNMIILLSYNINLISNMQY